MDPTLFAKLLALVVLGLAVAGIIADTVRAGTWFDAARHDPPPLLDVLVEVESGDPDEAPHVVMGFMRTSGEWVTTGDTVPVRAIRWRECPTPPVFQQGTQ